MHTFILLSVLTWETTETTTHSSAHLSNMSFDSDFLLRTSRYGEKEGDHEWRRMNEQEGVNGQALHSGRETTVCERCLTRTDALWKSVG